MRTALARPGTSPNDEGVHILLAPDKFKGSLRAAQVAQALRDGLSQANPGLTFGLVPIADGGDGTVAAAIAAGFQSRRTKVVGPAGSTVGATFAVRGDTAVIELAEASGLALLDVDELNPLTASSFGTGQLIIAALDTGVSRIILGVGGSASTDGGTGLLVALGARFLDDLGQDLPPGGGSLANLAEADFSGLDPRLAECSFILASDVDNPLTGPRGAAFVYGPQKGATAEQTKQLDSGLRLLAALVNPDAADYPGAGAAGGVGYAALAMLGATMRPGIDVIVELTDFDAELARADVVVTGEGRIDQQTLHGKGPAGIADRATAAGLAVWGICGSLELDQETLRAAGFKGCLALTDLEPDVNVCLAEPERLLIELGVELAVRLQQD